MPTIPDEKVQEVRDRVDIVDLVGRYVELRKAGRNYKGLCPFHQERTPSFNVNPQRKGFKCFGCGAGGDGLRFVMDIDGISFPEAVHKLAELYGVDLPANAHVPDKGSKTDRDSAYAIMRLATDTYQELLRDTSGDLAGRAYLEQRGISPQMADTFRLGYAPAPSERGWDTLARALGRAGLSLELAGKLGLVARSERSGSQYDRFRGRLMFPVIKPGGEVIAFSGRIVPPHDAEQDGRTIPKYINSAESMLYTKGKALFGLATARPAIRSNGRAILVEGNVDVVKLHQWGHSETIAPLGTALTPEQAQLLARFAKQAVMCFDGDAAGKKAAWAALPLLLGVDLDVRMVMLPQGEDPDSLGAERFAALLEGAKPALEEMMVRIAAKAGGAAHARARGLDRVVPLINGVPRESAREIYADRAASLFDLPVERIRSALRAHANADAGRGTRAPTHDENRSFHSTSDRPVPLSAAVHSLPPLPAGQADLAMLLVDVPHLATVAERAGVLDCVTDERLAPIVSALVDSAQRGENSSMPELLDLVPAQAQQQVHDAVFAGGYRAGEGLGDEDPKAILNELLQRCREHAIDDQIAQLEQQSRQAQDQGYPERVRELALERLALRRKQAQLRQQRTLMSTPSGEPAAAEPTASN